MTIICLPIIINCRLVNHPILETDGTNCLSIFPSVGNGKIGISLNNKQKE